MKQKGFTLVELLVVIVVLAILMAIALPLYMRSVRDSQKKTCRANMQTIAHAEQAYKLRSPAHQYTEDLTELVGVNADLQTVPRCPSDSAADTTNDYSVTKNAGGNLTIRCNSDNTAEAAEHNTVGADTDHGFTPGLDGE
jgi:type IV pilus assembly protein PilA